MWTDSKFFKFCLYVLRCAWDKWNSEWCLRTKGITKEAGSYTDYMPFYIKQIFFTAFMQIHQHVVCSRKKIQTPYAFRVILLPLTTTVLKYSWFQQLEEPKINFSASLPVSGCETKWKRPLSPKQMVSDLICSQEYAPPLSSPPQAVYTAQKWKISEEMGMKRHYNNNKNT